MASTTRRGTRLRTLLATGVAVVGCAAIGSLATDPDSAYYRGLRKPEWQPPPLAFPLVWTPLYADIAGATAVALDELAAADKTRERQQLVTAFAVNLGLNTAWSWLFFRVHRPWLAAAECAVLTVSSADLVRRVGAAKPSAGRVLAPYPAWCAFATALSVGIARRNEHIHLAGL
ncbi:tryptophan-rich sensory protein [Nakamurella antarctica]|uniref:Tryptophan-rich sensory protein n=1 Tax=Nakamurella antarctica TaxID=1902245 RepID=A0A3G8ZMU3_9ACTN|nr:TspO/MBR family protein [Nakamurella antarctica]AZI58458.1 tryptophan-rich sensory protein [Nakamurella antarctica]